MRGMVEVLEVRAVMDGTGADVVSSDVGNPHADDVFPWGFSPAFPFFTMRGTYTEYGSFSLRTDVDFVQLWLLYDANSPKAGEHEMLFEWRNYKHINPAELIAPMRSDDDALYVELINANDEVEVWSYQFQDGSIQLISGLPEHIMPGLIPVEPLPKLVFPVDGPHLIPNILFVFGPENLLPDWQLRDSIVDFKLSREPLGELGMPSSNGLIETQANPNNSFTEWDNVTGGLWVSVGEQMKNGPVDLTWVTKTNGSWLNDPVIVEALGDSFEVTTIEQDGVRVTTATLKGIDLSQYAWGQRILVAKLLYTPNANDPVGIPISDDGYHAGPIGQPVITLESASVGETAEAIPVSLVIPGRFYPVVYDTNDDGKVDLTDVNAFIPHFGKSDFSALGEDAYRFDFNRDGKINLEDFNLLVREFGSRKVAQPSEATATASPFAEEEPRTVVIGSRYGEWSYYVVPVSLVTKLETELDSTSVDEYLQWVEEGGDPLDRDLPLSWNTQVDDRILAAIEAAHMNLADDGSSSDGDAEGESPST